ncbi:amino acid ABC transporter [Rhizobium sp. Root1203]|jgi:antitoxin ParD1/3/4|uniref:ribbon-helix-helix domain-containing protein n=1 Tax=Rhizobium sp. Root1203 TaxID=1736427 RepID=UPI000709A13D|nr:type II toxin-antitoxin system ParD family antitoxin [Rhizobium sp. Root1203]KQV32477.1 amino acid ABC transporter [Rhizobium sp. Root1203]
MPMVTVSISPLQAADIRAAIDDGSYVSSSEVVREALRLWDAARKIDGTARGRDCDAADSKCVAEMFADHEAEHRRSA